MKYTQEENVVFTQGGDEMEVNLLKIEEGKEEGGRRKSSRKQELSIGKTGKSI